MGVFTKQTPHSPPISGKNLTRLFSLWLPLLGRLLSESNFEILWGSEAREGEGQKLRKSLSNLDGQPRIHTQGLGLGVELGFVQIREQSVLEAGSGSELVIAKMQRLAKWCHPGTAALWIRRED